MVSWNSCNGSGSALDGFSSRIYLSNETGDVNLNVFNMITKILVSKSLTKHTLCNYKCKCDGRKCNSNQKSNKELCRCESKIQ